MQASISSTLRTLGLVGALGSGMLSGQASAQASDQQGHADVGIAVRFGTLGVGLEVGKLLTSHVGARVGADYFKFNTTKTQSNIAYDASLKLQAVSALLDFYPADRGTFHLTAGAMTSPAKVTATGKSASGNFDINGTSYTAAQVGTLTAIGEFPSVGPYVGLGWGTAARNGGPVSFLFDIGAVIGTAKTTLSATGAAAGSQLAASVQAQQKKTQDDVSKFAKVYPVVQIGLAYRF